MTKIAFFDSSYISGFERHCKPQGMKFPPKLNFFGGDGMTAKGSLLMKELCELIDFQPDLVFVVLGRNDIKNDCIPQTIFSDIQCVVRTLQDSGISRIFVCEIIPRGNFKKVQGLTESRFNTIRTVINKRLRKDGHYGKYCHYGRY